MPAPWSWTRTPSLLKCSSVLYEVRFQFSSWKSWLLALKSTTIGKNKLLLYNLFHKVMFVTFPVPNFGKDPSGCT